MSPVWRVRLFIIFLSIVAAGMGYLYFTQRLTTEQRLALEQPKPSPTVEPAPSPEITNIAQILAVPYNMDSEAAASASAMLSFIGAQSPGMVVLFGDQVSSASAAESVTEILNETSIADRPLIAVDHEGGSVQRLSGRGFTRLPTWKRLCDQTALQRKTVMATSAAELKATGINIVFAPVVDVADSNIILKDRTCSGDPEVVGAAAKDFVASFEEQRIMSVIKHYPGLGSATLDTHDQMSSVEITERDVMPFKAVLDVYPEIGVMTAHIGVDNQHGGVPCSLSASCVGQIFDLYPEVVVFTDALEMKAARYNVKDPATEKSLATVAVEAVMAGNNVLVFGEGVSEGELEAVLTRIKQEYTSSSEFRQKVNNSVAKIKKLKAQYLPPTDQPTESEE